MSKKHRGWVRCIGDQRADITHTHFSSLWESEIDVNVLFESIRQVSCNTIIEISRSESAGSKLLAAMMQPHYMGSEVVIQDQGRHFHSCITPGKMMEMQSHVDKFTARTNAELHASRRLT